MSNNLAGFRNYLEPITDSEFIYVLENLPDFQVDNFTTRDISNAVALVSDYRYTRNYDGMENLNLSFKKAPLTISRNSINENMTMKKYDDLSMGNSDNTLVDRFNSTLRVSDGNYTPTVSTDIWTLNTKNGKNNFF